MYQTYKINPATVVKIQLEAMQAAAKWKEHQRLPAWDHTGPRSLVKIVADGWTIGQNKWH